MKPARHLVILLVMASAMSYYLYSYKPRNYNALELAQNIVINVGLWFFIFAIPYCAVLLLVTRAKRYFLK